MASLPQIASLSLIAGKPLIDNSDVICDKVKDRVQRIRRKSTTKVYEDRRDSDRGPSRPRGGSGYAYDTKTRTRSRGGYDSSESSSDDYRRSSRTKTRDQRRRKSEPGYDYGNESEGSIPPRNRQMVSTRNRNGQDSQAMAPYGSSRYANSQYAEKSYGKGTKSENDRNRSESDSDSELTSDLLDSEEDERQEKKKHRNELLTGGIAAVATLNAAANVYNSMKARELRAKQLAEGTITKEDAKKQRYKHHMQDAATIGLAALSIKGAYGKWQGTVGKHRERKAHREERKVRQEKRFAKGISRLNEEKDRAAAAARGRMAPGYEETARRNRPQYNRTYSRSVDDTQRSSKSKKGGQRSYGRDGGGDWEHGPFGGPGQRGHDESDMYNGMEELDGYDVTHS